MQIKNRSVYKSPSATDILKLNDEGKTLFSCRESVDDPDDVLLDKNFKINWKAVEKIHHNARDHN